MRQRQVLSLYRQFLKSVRTNLSDNAILQEEIRNQVKNDFRRNSNMTDHVGATTLIQEATRHLARIKDMNSNLDNRGGGGGGGGGGTKGSWINTEDKDDPRGRVGEGWPWG